MTMRAEIGAAFMLLTRLPVGWLVGDRAFPPVSRCVWAYPLVGALVGGAGAAAFWLGRQAGLPPGVCALWAVAAQVALTGGLHEDGLADMADGFGGGRTVERKLAIMRDSRIGSFGAVALVLAVSIRWSAVAASAWPEAGLVAAGALSRAAMTAPAVLLTPARADGLGAALQGVGRPAAIGWLLAAGAAWTVLPGGAAAVAIGVGGCVAVAIAGLARAQIGGFTGDVLGGCAAVSECAVLSVLAAR